MADGIDVKFDTSKLLKALDEMPKKMQRKHLRKGVAAGAKPILERMQAKCPVNTTHPVTPGSTALGPGVLKASLRTKITTGKDGATAWIGAPEGTGHVAYWMEKGFQHKRGNKVKDVPGTYFMTGAADEAATRAIDAMVEAIGDSMEGDSDG